ncbi:hypothetical protein [Halovivax limisalsi]|uniref:hypothetical protein n=1 Tax=Halovivax limisalsi TaxID=1453760 RepID=UPI001FFC764D|nr:hypothetical protein [Halovivax limisalsi]
MVDVPVCRRRVLAAVSATTVSGCASRLLADSGTGIRIGNIQIANWEDEFVEFSLRIERSGEQIFSETVELPGNEDTILEEGWGTEFGEYVLVYSDSRNPNVNRQSLAPSDHPHANNGDCIDIRFHCQRRITDFLLVDEETWWGTC